MGCRRRQSLTSLINWRASASCAYRTPHQPLLRNSPLRRLRLLPRSQVHYLWATTKGWAWVLRPRRLGSTSKRNKRACSLHLRSSARAARLLLFPQTRASSRRLCRLRRASVGSYLRVPRHRRRTLARSPRVFLSPHRSHRSLLDFNRRWHRSQLDSNLLLHNHSLLDFNRPWHHNRLASNRLWHHSRLASSRRSGRSRRAMAWGRRSGEACHRYHRCHLSPHHSRMVHMASYSLVSCYYITYPIIYLTLSFASTLISCLFCLSGRTHRI